MIKLELDKTGQIQEIFRTNSVGFKDELDRRKYWLMQLDAEW